MKHRNLKGCLTAYLKGKLKALVLFAVFFLIFLLVFFLYHLPMESVLYAFLLCCCIGFIALVLDFLRYYKIHHQLTAEFETLPHLLDGLPPCASALEKDYRQLIRELLLDRNRMINENESSRQQLQDYYAMWVHQIKVPISALRLMLGEDGKSSPQGVQLFRIEQYVEMALSYTRLESETTDYLFQEYPLEPIVKQAVKKYAPLFISKKLPLDIGNLPISVVTDEKWLGFAIEQILSNSLKYTQSGKISIYLKPPAILIIEDTGIGIAPEDINRVGEKGFTGYNGRSGKKSTGLGLYLCKEIFKRLNHGMRIESEPGRGTRVLIDLSRNFTLPE